MIMELLLAIKPLAFLVLVVLLGRLIIRKIRAKKDNPSVKPIGNLEKTALVVSAIVVLLILLFVVTFSASFGK
jgi:hypothetical protein